MTGKKKNIIHSDEDSALEGQVLRRRREAARRAVIKSFAAVSPRPGRWLRQWRFEHNMSQEVLSAALEVSSRSIKRWEAAEELPRIVALALEGK